LKPTPRFRRLSRWPLAALGALTLAGLLAGGCQTPPAPPASVSEAPVSDFKLREGDVITVSFPAAANLDAPAQTIRQDGKITLAVVGEVTAAGLTPAELQTKLLGLYADQLQSKEVMVTLVSSAFSVYVDGAALRPGKVTSDHPLTVMEAILEAGGFDYGRADTKRVVVMRHTYRSTKYDYITLNLQSVIDGKQRDLFYLTPGDIVHIPEKFAWF
jgi:polysaccharide export outer membrane protein